MRQHRRQHRRKHVTVLTTRNADGNEMYVLHIHSEAINTLAEASMTKADDRVSKELLTVLSGDDADEIERTVNRLP